VPSHITDARAGRSLLRLGGVIMRTRHPEETLRRVSYRCPVRLRTGPIGLCQLT